MKTFICALVVLLFAFEVFSQQPKAIDSLTRRIANAAADTAKVNLLDDLCWEYLSYDPKKSIPFANEAILLARKIGYKRGEGRLLNTLGTTYTYMRNFPLALTAIQDAIKVKSQIGDTLGIAKCLVNIGNIYQLQAYYDQAIAYHLKGLVILELLGNRADVASTYNNIASVYEHQENYPQVFYYASKGLALAEAIHHDVAIMDSKILLGDFYTWKKDYPKSLQYYNDVLKIAIQQNDLFSMSISYHNSADVNKRQNRMKEAIALYGKQLEIAERLNSVNDRRDATMGLGETYLLTGDYRASEANLSRALALSKELNTRDETKQIYSDLSSLYERKKDYATALKFHKLFLALKDSLFDEAKSRQIQELDIAYETERKENEIKILSQNNQLQTATISNERLLRNFSLTGLSVFFIMALLLFITNRQRKKANELLTIQKQDLQIANGVKTKLFSAISHDLRSPLASLHGLLQIMAEKHSNESLRPLLDHANAMMSNSLNLLDNLLYWSVNQIKGIPIQAEKLDVHEIAEEMKDLWAPLSDAKQVSIINKVKKKEWVYADAACVRLVFRNLISNAVKFTPSHGSITVSARPIGNETEISIADTGVGIDPLKQAKLFTNELSSTRGTSNENGSGLGLLLCKEFIEKNGGKISVESNAGKGAVVRFTLKAYDASADPSLNRLTNFLSTTEA